MHAALWKDTSGRIMSYLGSLTVDESLRPHKRFASSDRCSSLRKDAAPVRSPIGWLALTPAVFSHVYQVDRSSLVQGVRNPSAP